MSALQKFKERCEILEQENNEFKKKISEQEELIEDLFCLHLAQAVDYSLILKWFEKKYPDKFKGMYDIVQDKINSLYRNKEI